MPRPLFGVLPIIHVPFLENDAIDTVSLRRVIDWAFAQGVDGVGTGMVSELLRLTHDERIALTSQLVEMTAGRGSAFMSVGAESVLQAVDYAQVAAHVGCDAVMATPPISLRLGETALFEYYCRLADAIAIPVIVQDASGYVGQGIPLGVHVRLLERYGPDKILFKPEASPIGPNLSALRDATRGHARIFEGSGGIALVDSFRRGITGTMPGLDLLDGIVALWRALQTGDDDAAYRVSFPIGAIVAIELQAGLAGFLAIEKYLLVRRGLFPSDRRRAPTTWELDSETAREIDRLFARLQAALKKCVGFRPV